MLADTNSLVINLRLAFSHNKGLLLTGSDGIKKQVFPLFLGLNSEHNPSLKYIPLDASSEPLEILLKDITAVTMEPSLNVPSEISSAQGYWESRFFSYSPSATDLASQLKHEKEASPYNANTAGLLVDSIQNNQLPREGQIPYSHAEITAKKKKNKTVVISAVVTGFLVLGGTAGIASGVFVNSNATANLGGEATNSPEEDYEKWSAESQTWQSSDEYTEQVSGTTRKFLIAESPKLTDYDHFSWNWPLYSFDGTEDYLDASDRIPEGWNVDYSTDKAAMIPALSVGNDPQGTYDNLSYKSEQGDILVGSAILSKSKMEELGKTDDEVTRSIMVGLTSSAKGIEPKLIKVYDSSLSPEDYVEFYEFTYADSTGKEIHYAVRAFQSNGKVLVLANNLGWPTENMVDNGFTFSLFIFPAYPMDEERQAN
jgi:hypothetical protein